MTRKTAESYKALFEYIEKEIFELIPNEFMTDYEDGMRLAIKTRWPNVKIRGCWFHYSKAILKRCNKLNLRKILKENADAKAIKMQLAALPLLPAHQIEEGFAVIKKSAKKKKLSKRFERLFSYVRSYWLNSQVCIQFSLIKDDNGQIERTARLFGTLVSSV